MWILCVVWEDLWGGGTNSLGKSLFFGRPVGRQRGPGSLSRLPDPSERSADSQSEEEGARADYISSWVRGYGGVVWAVVYSS